MAMDEIRILMVDDHGLFRESLGRLLAMVPRIRVVGQCANAAEARAVLAEAQPDVILLDYDLGEESGLGLLADVTCGADRAKVLMVTAGMHDDVILRVMEMGAQGIFLKHNSPERLVQAIETVASGEVWLADPALKSLLAERRHRTEHVERARPLTARQREVLRGILDGLANKEIASRLNTSETAVKAAIQELFHKAGVRTRSQLVRIAIEQHPFDWLRPSADRA